MNIQIRLMKPEESKKVRALGRKAFPGFEKLFVSKPEDALIAEYEGKLAGAILYKIYTVENRKIGYIDFAFTDPKLQGKGIGSILYDKTIKHLWDLGCDYVGGVVKDDNVGSWGLFLKYGLKRISLVGMLRELGLKATSTLVFGTGFFCAIGMEYYLAAKNKEIVSNKENTAKQLPIYLLVNLLLFTLFAIRADNPMITMASMAFILSGSILTGYMATKFSDEAWHYRINDGGFAMSIICYIVGGILPMVGNWYPNTYKKGNAFKRTLGITALSQWLFILAITSLNQLFTGLPVLLDTMSQLAVVLLVLNLIPFYPFESFGGARVYRWNKAAYVIMAILSLAVLFIL